jgi:hypothetical protein
MALTDTAHSISCVVSNIHWRQPLFNARTKAGVHGLVVLVSKGATAHHISLIYPKASRIMQILTVCYVRTVSNKMTVIVLKYQLVFGSIPSQ